MLSVPKFGEMEYDFFVPVHWLQAPSLKEPPAVYGADTGFSVCRSEKATPQTPMGGGISTNDYST